MGLIPEKEIEEVRRRADIVAVVGERVPLKRAGRNLKANCPFHGEKTPSFMVNPEKQIYHCFGCGEGGDVFRFLMKLDGVSFGEAIERLADRFGVALTSERCDAGEFSKRREERQLAYQINRLAARYFFKTLRAAPNGKAKAYLQKRQIDAKIAEECLLGYAPSDGQGLVALLQSQKLSLELASRLGLVRKNERGWFDFFRDRLIFPILSSDGKVLGFSGRALEDEQQPKYLNSPDTIIYNKSESLLGIQIASEAIRQTKRVILVEGNVDWLRLVQLGIRNVVAPLGTALTERQIKLLSRFSEDFVLLFDGDAAGVKAAERALELFLPLGIMPRVVLLPAGEDPDSYGIKQGGDRLRELLLGAPYFLDVVIEQIMGGGLPDRSRAIARVTELLNRLPGTVEKTLYIQKVADHFGVPERVVWERLSGKKNLSVSTSNFLSGSADAKGTKSAESRLPRIEEVLVELLLAGSASGHGAVERLLGEVGEADFSHPLLREIWRLCREQWQAHGVLEVASLVGQMEQPGLRELATRLSLDSELWIDSGAQAVQDCLRRFRLDKVRGRLKNLSKEIRSAEGSRDLARLGKLVEEQNTLMKEMRTVH